MKLGDVLPKPPPFGLGQDSAFFGQQASQSDASAIFDEPEVVVELSFNVSNKDNKENPFSAERTKKKTDPANGLVDESGMLTRLLVSASTKAEVSSVLSRAFKNLGDALMAASSGDKDAMDIVRRLNKLIRRANKKLRDLDKEDELRQKQKRAEKKKLEQLARQHEKELKQKLFERKQRERKYLRDAHPSSKKPDSYLLPISLISLEAQMSALSMKLNSASLPGAPVVAGSVSSDFGGVFLSSSDSLASHE